jgi:hypothetical protein
MKLLLNIISFCFLFPSIAFSAWTGPEEILSLSFGNGEAEIGLVPGDIEDQFTTLFAVDKVGNVLIADEYNRKALFFNNAGQHLTTIRPKIALGQESWPNKIFPISNNRLVIASGYDYQNYDYQGNLLNKINVGDNTALVGALMDGSLIILKGNIFYKYSSAGQLVQSYKTRPLELGYLHKSVPSDDNYLFTLEYPDLTYSFAMPTRIISTYYRDAKNQLGISFKPVLRDKVYKINTCGKALGQVQLPDDEISGYVNVGGEKYPNYIARYGNATFGADGNVYTWKKKENNYSILKWTWVDDPNVPTGPDAPTGLTIMPSTTGLYLTWTASPNDPGCVTGYEVARATTSGGVTSTVATVDKGVVKYNDTTPEAGTTYYYNVRAKAGSEYSSYTSEVSGKR